jgi:hypothetical protein
VADGIALVGAGLVDGGAIGARLMRGAGIGALGT